MTITAEQADELHVAAGHTVLRAVNLSVQHGSVSSGCTVMIAALTEFSRQVAKPEHAADLIQSIADAAVSSLKTMPPIVGPTR